MAFVDALIDEIFTATFLTRHHGSLFEKFLLRQQLEVRCLLPRYRLRSALRPNEVSRGRRKFSFSSPEAELHCSRVKIH